MLTSIQAERFDVRTAKLLETKIRAIAERLRAYGVDAPNEAARRDARAMANGADAAAEEIALAIQAAERAQRRSKRS